MVIASRTLKWQTETGVVDVPILILAPEKAPRALGRVVMRSIGPTENG